MDRVQHPGIWQFGKIIDDGQQVAIKGWGLTYCMTRCRCHLVIGSLRIFEDASAGRLGLYSTQPRCRCCVPWTLDELERILTDLRYAEGMPTTPGG